MDAIFVALILAASRALTDLQHISVHARGAEI